MTSGETDLSILIRSMKPVLQPGTYVFCTVREEDLAAIPLSDITGFFREGEGPTVVVREEVAFSLGWPYSFTASWITLTVHSALAAVGLTAAFSGALARHGIACNVIAGYYHDHIFVEAARAEKALSVLEQLAGPDAGSAPEGKI